MNNTTGRTVDFFSRCLGHAQQLYFAPFAKPSSGRIAVKVINHFGDEVMKVFRVD